MSGDRVRVRAGPFAGHVGPLLSKADDEARVLIDVCGRPVPITFRSADLEPEGSASRCEGHRAMSEPMICPRCDLALEPNAMYTPGRDVLDGHIVPAMACVNHGAFGMRDGRIFLVDPVANADDF